MAYRVNQSDEIYNPNMVYNLNEQGTGYGGYNPGSTPSFGMQSNNWNMNYPDYGANSATEIGGAVSTGGDTMMAAAPAAGPAAPIIAGAGLGLKTVGTVADIYGKYQEREEAKKRYEQQLQMYKQAELERQKKQAMEDQRRSRQEGYFASDFNQDMMDRLSSTYGNFQAPGA